MPSGVATHSAAPCRPESALFCPASRSRRLAGDADGNAHAMSRRRCPGPEFCSRRRRTNSPGPTAAQAAFEAPPAYTARCLPKALTSKLSQPRRSPCPCSPSVVPPENSFRRPSATSRQDSHASLPHVGHYAALEAPQRLAEILLPFFASAEPPQVDGSTVGHPR